MSPSAVHVEDNPVIDRDWYAGEMSALTAKLQAAFPHVSPETIAVAIDLATQRIAATARIPNYLPVLIDRDVRAQLAAYGATTPRITLPPVPAAPAPAAPPRFALSTAEPVHPPAF